MTFKSFCAATPSLEKLTIDLKRVYTKCSDERDNLAVIA